ncbi:hypothetical protein TruAng_011423 [Truncatella angustata]|nr:hypothetical protein TruAng_011423 [Truncatella angustata]
MASHGRANHASDEQPSLEVNYQPGLEVDTRYSPAEGIEAVQHQPYQDEPKLGAYNTPDHSVATISMPGTYYPSHGHTTPTLSNYNGPPYQAHNAAETLTPPKKTRKALWIVLGVISVLVVMGAVLGGVLGSRAAKSSSSNDSPSNNDTPATNSTNVRAQSRLAVSGYNNYT